MKKNKESTGINNQQFSNQIKSHFTDNPLLQHNKDAGNNLIHYKFNIPHLYFNCQCSTSRFDEFSSTFKGNFNEYSSSVLFIKLVIKSLQQLWIQTEESNLDFQLDKIKMNHSAFGQQQLDGLNNKNLEDIYADFKV